MTIPLVIEPAAAWSIYGKNAPDSNLRFIDVRPLEAYDLTHVPEAVHLDSALLNRHAPPINGLLPTLASVNNIVQSLGITREQNLVVYDAGRETAAARLIWVLHAYGFTSISWLNGGFGAWQASKLPTGSTAVSVVESDISLTHVGNNVISVEQLHRSLGDPAIAILDVRSLSEFIGTDVRAAVGGHIPGAVHYEWTDVLDNSNNLLANDVLLSELHQRGITPDKQVIVYCQSHQRSSVTYVLLTHLGFAKVRALDGAWSAWGNQDELPVIRGH